MPSLLLCSALLVFGELHGTNEIERYVASRTIEAAKHGRVHLGLELPVEDAPLLEKFLAGQGDDGLRDSPRWRDRLQYGVTSKAMFRLLADLREARRHGAKIEIYFFDDRKTLGNDGRDEAMARVINAQRARAPDDQHLVLVGNFHARKTIGAPWDPKRRWMASWLTGDVTTFDVRYDGGSAWVCFSDDKCGVEKFRGNAGSEYPDYDGIYPVGPISASLPQFEK
jgi:hypothetical protein